MIAAAPPETEAKCRLTAQFVVCLQSDLVNLPDLGKLSDLVEQSDLLKQGSTDEGEAEDYQQTESAAEGYTKLLASRLSDGLQDAIAASLDNHELQASETEVLHVPESTSKVVCMTLHQCTCVETLPSIQLLLLRHWCCLPAPSVITEALCCCFCCQLISV